MTNETERDIIDREHLRILALLHYVMGGLTIAFASFFILHFALFLHLALHPPHFNQTGHSPNGTPQPTLSDFPYKVFVVGVGCFILLGWTVGGLTIYSGRCLARRKQRAFSTVVGAINCLGVPFGTVLGVFTLIVLGRPSVSRLYESGGATPAPAATP